MGALHRSGVLLIAALVYVAGCNALADPEDMANDGLKFDRIQIGNHSGDVKLIGDLDGDGKLDFVLGGLPGDSLSWWRWPDLRRTLIADPRVEFTTHGALADIDGDGDLDIVIGDGSDGANLVWFQNPGPRGDPTETSQWKRETIGTAGGWVKDVAVADFDNDGRQDVVIRAPKQIMILFQDAPGVWSPVILRGFSLGEEGMASGDIDNDGDIDLVVCGQWAQNPGGAAARDPAKWRGYGIGPFSPAFKALVVDLDRNGRPDVLTSSSEHTADVAWFSADNGPTGKWTRHVIQSNVERAHTLQAADMDGDGDIDVVVGQMHTSKERALAIHYNVDGRGTRWARQVIATTGLHNGVVADIEGDGDFDIFGSNWASNPPLQVWINRLDPPAGRHRLDRWAYLRITDAHVRSFGLAFADVNGDSRKDIISGPFWYRQPARPWDERWEQIRIGEGLDAIAAFDIDGDGRAEILAQRGTHGALQFVWLKATSSDARTFQVHIIGDVPAASHNLGSQGHVLAWITRGMRSQLAVSSGQGVYYFDAPGEPASGPWNRTRVCAMATDEGITFADIDGDGSLDLITTIGNTKGVAWWRNPGDGSADWQQHEIGSLPDAVYLDRVGVADLDGDGRLDVVVTEENGKASGARAVWWRQPLAGAGKWDRREITSRGSLNSFSIADMDGDGDMDLVMAEHRGALRTSIWNNLGGGRFVEQLIWEGAESHLGAQTVDFDGDGHLDIVSLGWDRPSEIHVWRNMATAGSSVTAPARARPGKL